MFVENIVHIISVMTHPYPMFVKIRYTTKIGKYCVAFVVNYIGKYYSTHYLLVFVTTYRTS